MAAEHYGISLRKLSKSLGLSSAQVFYDLKSGKVQGISPKLLESIKANLPEIDSGWLVTGKGDMLVSSGKNSQVIGSNKGTAINGDGAIVSSPEQNKIIKRMQDQIDELLAQNGKLLNIVEQLTLK